MPTTSEQRKRDDDKAGRGAVPGSAECSDFGVSIYTADGNLRKLTEIEADVICHAVSLYGGRMSEVARRLRIGRSTLYRKLGELGIDAGAR